jgi:hypothetical protein
VTDEGPGVAEKDEQLLFKSWSQIHEQQQDHCGFGLGLSLCKEFVERGHKGSIGVHSVVGQGSTFYFEITFPVHSESRESTPFDDNRELSDCCIPKQSPNSPDSPLFAQPITSSVARVLAIDDSTVTRMLMRRTFESIGVVCDVFGDIEQALSNIRAHKYDLITVDYEVGIT